MGNKLFCLQWPDDLNLYCSRTIFATIVEFALHCIALHCTCMPNLLWLSKTDEGRSQLVSFIGIGHACECLWDRSQFSSGSVVSCWATKNQI